MLAIGISFESNAHLAAIYAATSRGSRQGRRAQVGVVSPPEIDQASERRASIGLRVPFTFFESASFVYDYDGRPVRTTANKGPTDN